MVDDHYFLDILIPFDLLVDTDVGIVSLVTEKYNDTRYFNTDRMEVEGDEDNKIYSFLFQYRNEPNPLFLITKVDLPLGERNIINNLYKELMEKEYVEILRHSQTTSIYDIFNVGNYGGNGPFRVTVVCKNDLDVEYLRQINFKCNTIICKDNSELTKIDINNYNHIYVKHIEDALDYRYMSKKNIYIANYRFNNEFVDDPDTKQIVSILKPEIVVDLISDNKIKVIDVYPQPEDLSI